MPCFYLSLVSHKGGKSLCATRESKDCLPVFIRGVLVIHFCLYTSRLNRKTDNIKYVGKKASLDNTLLPDNQQMSIPLRLT
jgi:hypothetical protein